MQVAACAATIAAAVDAAGHTDPCVEALQAANHSTFINATSRFEAFKASLRDGGTAAEQAAAKQCLDAVWSTRHDEAPLFIAALLLSALSAWLYMPLVLCVADVVRVVSRGASRLLLPSFFTFGIITTLELVFQCGLTTTTNWMWSSWDLDLGALRVLTLAYWTARSATVWFFALDLLFLGIGMLAIWYATRGEDRGTGGGGGAGGVPLCLSRLSLAIGALCCVYFVLELARFGAWVRLSQISFLVLGVVGFVLLPAWLVWWARVLGRLQRGGGLRSLLADGSGSRGLGGGSNSGGGVKAAPVVQLATRKAGVVQEGDL
eukprot:g7084.t1